jgi:hypothetical protein
MKVLGTRFDIGRAGASLCAQARGFQANSLFKGDKSEAANETSQIPTGK